MMASIKPPTLPILQTLKEKWRKMTIRDFGLVHCLVHTPALTSYNVDLKGRTVVGDGKPLVFHAYMP